MEREYIKIPKSSPLPNSVTGLKELDDKTWKNEIFYHLLLFYQNYDMQELKDKIELGYPRTERVIAKFIRIKLNNNRHFGYHFYAFGENTNDEDVEGNYDITIHSTNWKSKNFHFECKNLKTEQDYINKYVYTNIYPKNRPKEKDGGIYRYFNGKYAQNLNFGGVIGFVLEGDIVNIKTKIIEKLEKKFDITPEGDLLNVIDNSIEENNFTFNSKHNRKNKEFLIHHLLFDFTS